MKKPVRYVALGGCNTAGEINNIGNAYPNRIAQEKGWLLENYGYTMSSTREGIQFFNLNNVAEADVLTIQFGGVDSWLTFKGSPFVLYYPDSPWRKFKRKIVKKIKKYARKLGWHKLVGTENVVPKDEYRQNLQRMIQKSKAKIILLIDTYPNQDMTREPRIKAYNEILKELADNKKVFHIENYDLIKQNLENNFDDSTHLSSKGQQIITDLCLQKIATSSVII